MWRSCLNVRHQNPVIGIHSPGSSQPFTVLDPPQLQYPNHIHSGSCMKVSAPQRIPKMGWFGSTKELPQEQQQQKGFLFLFRWFKPLPRHCGCHFVKRGLNRIFGKENKGRSCSWAKGLSSDSDIDLGTTSCKLPCQLCDTTMLCGAVFDYSNWSASFLECSWARA